MRHKGSGVGHYGLVAKKRKVKEINVMLTKKEEARYKEIMREAGEVFKPRKLPYQQIAEKIVPEVEVDAE